MSKKKATSSHRNLEPQPRDLAVLPELARYTVLSRRQIERLCGYTSDRVARRGLNRLCHHNLESDRQDTGTTSR